MKTGDFISIDYTGKIKESGEIFDVTIEDVAKKNNIYNPRVEYRPVNIVVGGEFTIKGLDDALKEMKVGDKKNIVVNPDKAFGERNPKLIRPMPLSNFKDQNINPVPGSFITINGIQGKIVSADGGRIKVDFNHPLAGKSLEYDVEVKSEITATPDKVKAVVSFILGVDPKKVDVKLHDKEADVSVKMDEGKDVNATAKKKIAELAIKWVAEIEKLRFVEEFDGKEEKKEEAKPEEKK